MLFVHVRASSGHHVNITIFNQSYVGQRTMDCKYGGIAFVEKTRLSHNEVVTICESHNRIVSHNRNIFSHGSSLIIVTYWYKNYSNMSVSLNVTKTRCQSVQIDICKFHTRCQSHYNVKQCLKYVGPIFQSSNISFNYNHLRSQLQYSLRVNQCVIFQFMQDFKYDTIYEKGAYYKYLSHCQLNIKASTFQKPGYTINYMFKGSSRHSKSDNYWYISFKGLNDRFCHKMGMNKSTYCLLRICSKINCFGNQYSIFSAFYQKYSPFYKISNKNNETEFLILVETKTPTFDTSFDFELKFARWTPGWINVMVWITETTYNSRLQYHTEVIPIRKERMRIKSVIGNPNSILYLHLNTSKTSSNVNIVLLLAMYSLIEPRPWKYYYNLQLSWIKCFKLSNMFETQPVSIPGSVTRVAVVAKEMHNITSEDKLEAFWINNRHSRYTNLNLMSVKKSYCLESVRDQKLCNYSSYEENGYFKNKYYYLYESRSKGMTGRLVATVYPKLWSWKDANDLCRDIGGHLPYFLSREELEELVDFLKNSPHILPYEAIYIGMTINSKHKVKYSIHSSIYECFKFKHINILIKFFFKPIFKFFQTANLFTK